MEGGDEGLVHDLALVTADGRLRILRGPEQALDVGVVVEGEVYLGGGEWFLSWISHTMPSRLCILMNKPNLVQTPARLPPPVRPLTPMPWMSTRRRMV